MTGGVFINYRGGDSQSYGALLYTELSRVFGSELVFLDSASIPPGADFVEQLLGQVRGCRVLLAVIGPRWLTVTDAHGRRRLADPQDWIRRELAEAFTAGVTVVPVLTDDADLPSEAELPVEIARLARCQYRRLRYREVITDLGRLRADLVAADRHLAAAVHRTGQPRPPVVPAQLPADVYGFAGRAAHLDRLDALLGGAGPQASAAVVVAVVSGIAGMGKTALAVHWAHRVANQFPAGQLYVDLRGYGPGGPAEPAAAVRGFLEALGVRPERIPADPDAQIGLYRSLLAGKRILVVLDNARDADHVRPLLPGTPTAMVVVTSRSQLISLVAAGAHPIPLDLLTDDDAGELLAHRVGADRVAAEPEAARDIVAACARVPLALALVAARVASQRAFTLTAIATEVGQAGARTGQLDAGEVATQVRTVFSWSYTALTPPAARLFRLLGLQPGPDISVAAAASLAGIALPAARALLAELGHAGLLAEQSPGRYGFHDLLAAYAADLAGSVESAAEARLATTRLLDHYTHSAHDADRLLDPFHSPVLPLAPPAAGVTLQRPADHAAALAWLTAEHSALLAALHHAAAAGFDSHTWQLAWALTTFLHRRGHWNDQAAAWQAALAAAERLDHPAALAAHAYRGLARAAGRLGDYGQAHSALQHALDLYRGMDDHNGQARTHITFAWLWEQQRRRDRSLDHDRQALDLFRVAGNRHGEANALNNVGLDYALLGEPARALPYCEQALKLHTGSGDRDGQAAAWHSLGQARHDLGQFEDAARCFERAVELTRDLGNRFYQATALTSLGDSRHAAGDRQAGRAAWTQALDILTNLDHPDADSLRAKLTAPDDPHTGQTHQ